MRILHLSPEPRCQATDRNGQHCARPESHGDDKHDAYNGTQWIPDELPPGSTPGLTDLEPE